MEGHYFEVNINWNRDRKGIMCSPDITSLFGAGGCVEVATPPQFNKGIPGVWSPEHLFTAAVGSCLMTTFLAIAENSKLEFTGFRCSTKGKLEQVDNRYLMTEVVLEPPVTIVRDEDRERALRVLQKSEAACLISNSIKSSIRMTPWILVEAVVG